MPHTKGPWRLTGWPPLDGTADMTVTATSAHGNPIWLGRVYGQGLGVSESAATREAVANARLIAAAPELLEALKNLANFPYGHERTTCSDGEPYCDCGFGAAIEKAREGVARVTAED